MVIKVYKAKSRLITPVVIGGKVVRYAEFTDADYTYVTSDERVQEALEKSPAFQRYFVLLRTVGDSGKKGGVGKERLESGGQKDGQDGNGADWTEYAEVTDWQGAKEILRGEPYKIAYQVLGSPDAIVRKAEELKVRFPNLVR